MHNIDLKMNCIEPTTLQICLYIKFDSKLCNVRNILGFCVQNSRTMFVREHILYTCENVFTKDSMSYRVRMNKLKERVEDLYSPSYV